MSFISFENVYKKYGKKTVLENINIEIPTSSAEIVGLFGENGAGKTTFLKLLSGLLLPNGGVIHSSELANGEKYDYWAREHIAYMQSGDRGLRLKNSARDNIIYYGLLKGTPYKTILDNINEYAPLMRVESLLDKRCESLSMGQKKKEENTIYVWNLCGN